jgi:hypothetical protein
MQQPVFDNDIIVGLTGIIPAGIVPVGVLDSLVIFMGLEAVRVT